MSSIVIRCPKCKTGFKVRDVERMDGKKIVCTKCQTPFRVHAPKKAAASKAHDEPIEIGDDAIVEDDFDVPSDDASFDDDYVVPAALPVGGRLAVRKKVPKKKSAASDDSAETKAKKTNKSTSSKVIIFAVLGTLGFVGLAVGGIFFMKGVNQLGKFEPPAKYVEFNPKEFPLSCEYPDGWERKSGGGSGGHPAWMQFTHGKIVIEVRESISGGALGQAAISAAGNGSKDPDRISPVLKMHMDQQRQFAEEYTDFHEDAEAKEIKTGYGEGRISDFSAKEGLFATKVKGCRATLLTSLHEFIVTCKCPPEIFGEVRPVFEKVVASISSGSSP